MRDLLIYIRAMLKGDPILLQLFVACGKTEVSVVNSDQRSTATYPRIILEGDDGKAVEFADDSAPWMFDTEVRLEIVTCKDDLCIDHVGTLRDIQARCMTLLLGDHDTNTEGLKGLKFRGDSGQAWNVSGWSQGSARFLTVNDPKYKRHLTKFPTQLCKTKILGG